MSLAGAVVFEVIGTAFLQKSEQFTNRIPLVLMIVFYTMSFYMLSQSLKILPLSVAYAIWGGIGIILTTGISIVVFKQSLDMAGFVGISLIVAGVVVVNLFSKSMTH
jgi:small multidrug resistance pump